MSAIEWTGETWNPSTGCDRVSPGCDHCYALTMAKRLKGMGSAKYQRDGDPRTSGPGFGITEHPDTLALPLKWRKPRKVFVNSMSDLFHSGVSDEFIARVFMIMAATPQHTYQVLTKRHGRMRSLLGRGPQAMLDLLPHPPGAAANGPWPLPNVHLGVSVEDQQRADLRIPALLGTTAAVRFLSCEPLLGPIKLHRGHAHCPTHDFPGGFCSSPCPDLILPDWVIIGGESGPGSRPMDVGWVRSLLDDCRRAGIAVFVKQLGSVWAAENGGPAKGGDPDHWPADLRVRQYPEPAPAVTP